MPPLQALPAVAAALVLTVVPVPSLTAAQWLVFALACFVVAFVLHRRAAPAQPEPDLTLFASVVWCVVESCPETALRVRGFAELDRALTHARTHGGLVRPMCHYQGPTDDGGRS